MVSRTRRHARRGPLTLAALGAAGLLGAGLVPAAQAADSSLVAAYDFNQGTGTVVPDDSGNGHAGTVSGAAWSASGKFGGALAFNGTSSLVTVPSSAALSLTTGMTLEAWVKPATSTGWQTLLMRERPGGMSYGLYGFDNTGKPPAIYGHVSSDVEAKGKAALALNVWTHVAGSYDGATLRIYVNGSQVGTTALTGSLTSSSSPLRIGGNSVWGEYFNGLIDEVRVYNRALSAAEIATDQTTPVAPAVPDSTPPVITTVAAAGVSATGASITWTTNEPADGVVDYGSSTAYGSTASATGLAVSHSVPLSGLTAGTTYHYRVHSTDAAGNPAVSADSTFTTTAPDLTAPTVAISAPAAGATVSGTVQVTAAAADDVGVAAVQFLLDGANLGAEDSTAPYAVSWNASTVGAGPHALTARARDTSGNATVSAGVPVTVDSSDPRSTAGSWSGVQQMGDIAQQAVLLPGSGKVLFYKDGDGAQVLDPVSGAVTAVPLARSDLFCAGQGILPDGRLLINGGQSHSGGLGIADNNVFDPATQTWSVAPSMSYRRWYPTMTPLGDGKQLSTSGSQDSLTDIAPVPELYDPVTNRWTPLPSANNPIPYYPFMYQLGDGRIVQVGATEQATSTQVLDPKTWTWSTVDPRVIDGGSSVMYAPGKFLKAGTSSDGNSPVRPSSAAAYVLDMNVPNPAWRQVASMAYPRAFLNLTLLPDGTVLVTGGESTADGTNANNAVNAAELWNPATETWTTLSGGQRPRFYHSVGLLLPDGRVLVSGGGNDGNVPNEPNYELYSPPYLFKGARPAISGVPSTLTYGSSFLVSTPDAADIASVRLIRPAAVTHSFDSNELAVPLSFTQTAGGIQVQAPSNPNLAVPGNYLLYVVNSKGVPAIAPFTRLPAPWEDKVAPSAPSALSATGAIGAATLSWGAATDNQAVTGYRVYRSGTQGFTPAPANLAGSATGTGFTDSGLPGGTYYYRVTAIDGAGNEGPPSNEGSAVVTADVTAPAVAFTAPSAGATVSGAVTLTATASDDVRVASVQFLADGSPVAGALAAAPYSTAWSSAAVANGSHTLTARATDSSGNVSTATVTVTVANSGPGGLVAAYGFNSGSGSTVTDASGNGNSGTLTGGSWSTSGKYGNALSFDGTSSWVTVPSSAALNLTTRMTVEAWVKPASSSGWRTVLMKERPGGMSYGLYGFDDSARPPAVYGHVSSDTAASGTAALPLGSWSHLAGTYDGSTLRIYVNGTLVGSKALTGSLATSSSALRIGGNSVWGEYFNGLIDEVRVYNRALSAGEIATDLATAIP